MLVLYNYITDCSRVANSVVEFLQVTPPTSPLPDERLAIQEVAYAPSNEVQVCLLYSQMCTHKLLSCKYAWKERTSQVLFCFFNL